MVTDPDLNLELDLDQDQDPAPDPALFVSGFQDSNKKKVFSPQGFLLITFRMYVHLYQSSQSSKGTSH